MQIFDTHTHLNVEEFMGENKELEPAKESWGVIARVALINQPRLNRIGRPVPMSNLTLGWHPTEAGDYSPEVEAYSLERLKHPKVVALGEIGLDYHWMTAPKGLQEKVFRRQIQLSELDSTICGSHA